MILSSMPPGTRDVCISFMPPNLQKSHLSDPDLKSLYLKTISGHPLSRLISNYTLKPTPTCSQTLLTSSSTDCRPSSSCGVIARLCIRYDTDWSPDAGDSRRRLEKYWFSEVKMWSQETGLDVLPVTMEMFVIKQKLKIQEQSFKKGH